MSSDSEVPVISFGSSNTTIGRPTPDPDSTDESDIGDMANTTAGLISNDSTVDENMPPIWPHVEHSDSLNNEVGTQTELLTKTDLNTDNGGMGICVANQQDTVYDAEGDLALIVGKDNTHKFQLSSKLLASTSTVWKDLIAAAKEVDSTTIHLPDDDPWSISILIHIINLQFTILPRSITFQELYSLACLSQKYQVSELLLPFVWRWAAPFIREVLDPQETQWILISWEFGIEYMFKQWIDHLLCNAEKNDDGCIVYRDHQLADLLPENSRDQCTKLIEDTRMTLLSNLIETSERGFEHSYCLYNGESPYEEQCNTLMIGYLFDGLTSFGEWPLDPSTIKISVQEFKACLLNLHSNPLPVKFHENNQLGSEDHSQCGFCLLRHEIVAIPLRMPLGLEIPFKNERGDAMSTSPLLNRWGFHSRDFEGMNSDSEGDSEYYPPTDDDSEPDEEFSEGGSEVGSNESDGEENEGDKEQNEGDQEQNKGGEGEN